ncbi:MAG: AraC family transcriptional regulator ligand-binding domain-containing protein [Luminiphilus sp.]|nr:AraC family transcriptional regulator ligand-binding domain-containing protein [Luminiphilus sp.]
MIDLVNDTPTVWRHSAVRVCVALEQLGANHEPLLSQLGICLEDLMTPGFRLRLDLMERLLVAASQLVDRKDFGLYVGQHVEPLANTAFKWSVALSETPAAALKRIACFSSLIDSSMSADFKAYGNRHAVAHVQTVDCKPRLVSPIYEDFMAAGLVALCQNVLLEGRRHFAVELTQSKPDDPEPWYECFGDEITWSAPVCRAWWNTSILRHERANSNERLARAHEVLARQQLTTLKSSGWKRRVEWLLITRVVGGNTSQQAIATALNVEVRTLQRGLKAEGTSFQELLSNARKSHALNQLSCNRPIAQIGYELGYTDPSAFSNAFKKWYGVSPVNYLKVAKAS